MRRPRPGARSPPWLPSPPLSSWQGWRGYGSLGTSRPPALCRERFSAFGLYDRVSGLTQVAVGVRKWSTASWWNSRNSAQGTLTLRRAMMSFRRSGAWQRNIEPRRRRSERNRISATPQQNGAPACAPQTKRRGRPDPVGRGRKRTNAQGSLRFQRQS